MENKENQSLSPDASNHVEKIPTDNEDSDLLKVQILSKVQNFDTNLCGDVNTAQQFETLMCELNADQKVKVQQFLIIAYKNGKLFACLHEPEIVSLISNKYQMAFKDIANLKKGNKKLFTYEELPESIRSFSFNETFQLSGDETRFRYKLQKDREDLLSGLGLSDDKSSNLTKLTDVFFSNGAMHINHSVPFNIDINLRGYKKMSDVIEELKNGTIPSIRLSQLKGFPVDLYYGSLERAVLFADNTKELVGRLPTLECLDVDLANKGLDSDFIKNVATFFANTMSIIMLQRADIILKGEFPSLTVTGNLSSDTLGTLIDRNNSQLVCNLILESLTDAFYSALLVSEAEKRSVDVNLKIKNSEATIEIKSSGKSSDLSRVTEVLLCNLPKCSAFVSNDSDNFHRVFKFKVD